MLLHTLVLLMTFTASGNEQVIDALDYANDEAARKVWFTDQAKLTPKAVQDSGRAAVQFEIPFASRPGIPRVSLDRKLALDLSAVGEFSVDMKVEDARAAGHVSLYFRSGDGWYSGSGAMFKKGWQTLRFSKAGFKVEDRPAGWHKIDAVRISVWRGQSQDSRVSVSRLVARWHDVALVIPAAAKAKGGEFRAALQSAETVSHFTADLGLGSDAVEDAALMHGALKNRRVAILAHNPQIDDEAVQALEQFIQQGGKVLACYSLAPRLAKALGFGKMKYVRPEQPGRLAEIRFNATDIQGLPKSVQQASWNVNTAQPVGHGARVIGQWYDRDGQPTGLPAMLISERGAYLSHIVLNDDPAGKRQLLAAVLGHLSTPLWKQMAQAALSKLDRIGHYEDLEQLEKQLKTGSNAEAAQLLQAAKTSLARTKELIQEGKFADAVETAHKARDQASEAYLRAQASPTREGRAFWNHSGTGAYPGDWDRTAKELAGAGFNMVIPNMLWAGLAHYESDLLPRSATVQKHGDQIAQCVKACKKHGIEVHVWKVNFNLSNAPKDFVAKLREQKRTQVSLKGEPKDWLCPSHPDNTKLELDSMLEVARKYDVDGLHFDYIRYPDGAHCYCDGCRERFEAQSGSKVANWPKDCTSGPRRDEYRTWRCQQITRLVEAVAREAQKIKPSIKISAAVFGSYPDSRESVGQDWVSWVKAGYLDFICPMDYAISDMEFSNLVSNQLKLIEGRIPMYPGIGAWRLGAADRVVGQMHYARQLGAAGFTVFDLSEDAAKTLLPGIGLGAGAQRAVPPHRK